MNEGYSIMTSIYNQKTATEMYGREQYAEGRAEGEKVGITKSKKEGMIEAFLGMVKDGLLSMKDAAKRLGISQKELTKLAGLY